MCKLVMVVKIAAKMGQAISDRLDIFKQQSKIHQTASKWPSIELK